jgi:hypothetical protein|tara:strand:+ start:230 stop:844 length:615 start_codon:yes stop_codon:yes gene_type:complete
MIRFIKICIGLALFLPLVLATLLTVSWYPFRLFFSKSKGKIREKGYVYVSKYSKENYSNISISDGIRSKHDLRTSKGRRAAFDEQSIRNELPARRKEEERQKRLKKEEEERQMRLKKEEEERQMRLMVLHSENKNLVTILLCIFVSPILLGLYLEINGTTQDPLLFFISLPLAYFTYLYFKLEPIAKLFNMVIRKIKDFKKVTK